MKKILFFFLIILSAQAQVTQQWASRYNGTGNSRDNASKVLVDKFTGSVFVSGKSNASGNDDIVTVKYNSAGVQQWIKIYNSEFNKDDSFGDMVLDNLGNLIVTGSSIGSSFDCITIKYDYNGNKIWSKRYSGIGTSFDQGKVVTTDGQGGIIVTGISSNDIVTLKYSYGGTLEWMQRYNNSPNSENDPRSIITDGVGNIYITGFSYTPATKDDFITIKYSPTGNVEWVKLIATSQHDMGLKVLYNYNTDEIYSVGRIGNNTIIECYGSSGNAKWQTSDNGALIGLSDAALDNAGIIYIYGTTVLNGNNDFMIIAYNTGLQGGLSWFDIYNGSGNGAEYPTDIQTDNYNNIYLTGSSQGSGNGSDYTTLKYNQSGIRQWEKKYNFTGTGLNTAVSLDVDNNGSVYVTGYSRNSAGNYDYATIKYTQGIIFGRDGENIPSEFKLFQNYPNPFNPATNIKFDIPKDADVKIAVYDMLGREVQIVADEFKQAGSYEIKFDASGLSSGTYFYKIIAGSFTDIKKMVLIK